MRRFQINGSHILLGLSIFCACLLPKPFSDKLRCSVASLLSYHWVRSPMPLEVAEAQRLRQENHFLRMQLERARAWLVNEQRIDALSLSNKGKLSMQKRMHALAARLDIEIRSMPAQVVFRDPVSWSNTLWIDVGEKHNEERKEQIIAKHSPVIVGDALVGVVESVGSRCSRVRLITDARLTISIRGMSEKEKTKGEVQGVGAPLWSSRGQPLKGMGFHSVTDNDATSVPPFSIGDVLVTSGLDGVFPPGLHVGTVAYADDAKSGSSRYGMEVQMSCEDLDNLSYVTVLPPIGAMTDRS